MIVIMSWQPSGQDLYSGLCILRAARLADAEAYADHLPSAATAYVLDTEDRLGFERLQRDVSAATFVGLYNALRSSDEGMIAVFKHGKDEGIRRLHSRVVALARTAESIDDLPKTNGKDTRMDEQTEAPEPKKSRAKNMLPAAEGRAVRDGTKTAIMVRELLAGTRLADMTAYPQDEVQARVWQTAKNTGIGYSIGEDGVYRAVLPPNLTPETAIKVKAA
jgi:hypothetical protein